jgi:hypothetical protein
LLFPIGTADGTMLAAFRPAEAWIPAFAGMTIQER